jgi:hypothetical protein
VFGGGVMSSSGAQRFPVRGKSTAARNVVIHGGQVLSTYTHVSDQWSTYGTKIALAGPSLTSRCDGAPRAGGIRFAFLGGLRLPEMRCSIRCSARPLSRSRCVSSGGWSTGSGPADRTVPGAGDPDEPRQLSAPARCVPQGVW